MVLQTIVSLTGNTRQQHRASSSANSMLLRQMHSITQHLELAFFCAELARIDTSLHTRDQLAADDTSRDELLRASDDELAPTGASRDQLDSL